jgi:ubiquinone/menaquinone biosynthesis C-methylase UbiE
MTDHNEHGTDRPRGFCRMPDDERRKWQNPEAILMEIGLKPGNTFMDIGCGHGFFTLPAAGIVGEAGLVYGVDTNRPAVKGLEDIARQKGIRNLKLRAAKAERTVFCEACADMIFFGIDLHDFQDPLKVLQNARKMIKPGGRLVDLDWKKEPSPWGPPLEIRFEEAKAQKFIEAAGFNIESVKSIGPYHYLIIARG